jgi:hypothetical protein
MGKKFWLAFVIAFILMVLLEFILHAGILSGFYRANPQGFLPENIACKRMVWMFIGMLLSAFIWTYLYNRFVPIKDLKTGAEFGVILMIFLNVPGAFLCYSLYVMSGYVYLWGTIGDVIIGAIVGGIMGVVFKPAAEAK